MTWLAPLVLLLCSSVALWFTRPVPQWHGASASHFMAALLGLITAVTLLLTDAGIAVSDDLTRIMLQACLYAGIPLIAAVSLADAFRRHWDRVIWGRVLLGLCAVFELGRRGDWLDTWLLVTLCAGLAGAVVSQIRQRQWGLALVLGSLWLTAAVLSHLSTPPDRYELWLICAIMLTCPLRTKTAA